MKKQDSINIGWIGIFGIITLCILSRLPQLMSPYLHADYNGDECVLGLMANHIAQGREFPFYFWGQSYGFSWIEAGAVALAIKFFGMTIFSLKIPMLILWTLGCVFFYSALALWTSQIYSFGITCLFILSPAWMSWSMRARGGYITAFLLSTVILFLLSYNWQKLNKRLFFVIGILSGFVLFSQPLYLLGLLPLLINTLIDRKCFKNIFILIIGFITIFTLGKVMSNLQTNTGFWKPVWFMPDHFISFALSFVELTLNALNQDSGKFLPSVFISTAWFIIIFLNLGAYIWGLITKKISSLSTTFLISVSLILGCIFFIDCESRYYLSLNMFLILWFGVLSFELFNKNLILKILLWTLISAFTILGAITAWHYKDFYRATPLSTNETPEIQKINKLIDYLNRSGVKYLFSLDDDLSWKIMYFSQEKIISRWAGIHGRQQSYINDIDQAFLTGQKVALVGNMLDEVSAYLVIANEGGIVNVIADPYFVCINPSHDLIANKLKFQLIEPYK